MGESIKGTGIFILIMLITLSLIVGVIGVIAPNRVDNALSNQTEIDISTTESMGSHGGMVANTPANASANTPTDLYAGRPDPQILNERDTIGVLGTPEGKAVITIICVIALVILGIIECRTVANRNENSKSVVLKDTGLSKYISSNGIPLSPLEIIELNNIIDYLKDIGGIDLEYKDYSKVLKVLEFNIDLPQQAKPSLYIKENFVYNGLISDIPEDMEEKPFGYEYSTLIYDMINHRRLYNEKVEAYLKEGRGIKLRYKGYGGIERFIRYLYGESGDSIEIRDGDKVEAYKIPDPNPILSNTTLLEKIKAYKYTRENLSEIVRQVECGSLYGGENPESTPVNPVKNGEDRIE